MKKLTLIFIFIFSFSLVSCSNKGIDDNPQLDDALVFYLLYTMIDSVLVQPMEVSDFLNTSTTPPSTISSASGSISDTNFTISNSLAGSLTGTCTLGFSTNYTKFAVANANKDIQSFQETITLSSSPQWQYNLQYKSITYAVTGFGSYTNQIKADRIYLTSEGITFPAEGLETVTGNLSLTYNNKTYVGTLNIDNTQTGGGSLTVNGNTVSFEALLYYYNQQQSIGNFVKSEKLMKYNLKTKIKNKKKI